MARVVRTPEGSEFYGRPIGTLISPGEPETETTTEVASYARLLSLYRMQKAAQRTGQYHLVIKYANAMRQEFGKYNHVGDGRLSKLLDEVVQAQDDKGFTPEVVTDGTEEE